ncbi:MAG TPA: TetR family transcriptional regulator [Acidimicrobiales bacterium]|nr:TetR family transcriptional regulator [Acidimicrobiales bacterium]
MTVPQAPPAAGRQPGPHRSRDAVATTNALLRAAQDLFGQQGFERTTIRDIGDRAGVDASLIARYFGSKADLYIAAVVAEGQGDQPAPALEQLEDMARTLITRTDRQGLGPVTQALIRSDSIDEIRAAAQAHMARRMVEPMVAELNRRGSDRPRLRAEAVVSALVGINLARALGWFDELNGVPQEDLVELIAELLGPGPGPT